MAILLALGCLICSALNDFLFKLFAGRQGPRGMFITIIGCVWLLALLGMPVEWNAIPERPCCGGWFPVSFPWRPTCC